LAHCEPLERLPEVRPRHPLWRRDLEAVAELDH
jgi:hypothetical protein